MRSMKSYTPDALTQMKDAGLVAATAAGTVAAVARVLDFGGITSGPAVEQVAYTSGAFVVDVTVLERATGDEFYDLIFQLSDNTSGDGTGFAAGDIVVPKGVIHIGEELGLNGDPDADGDIGRIVIGVDNERFGTLFRFARLMTVVGGTVATGINFEAFFAEGE